MDRLLPEIVKALAAQGRVVIEAPPGTGKTTRVPGALVDAFDGDVIVLEPRRIAARAAAEFVARARGGRVGGEVGYRVRFDRKGDGATRLWFVTEGLLTRQLAQDPFLENVGVLVLDEFHERHTHGDVALAVALELQRTVRPDLKVVVMSATLDARTIAARLGDCPRLQADARRFPVDVEYVPSSANRRPAERVERAVVRALDENADGDILVFLPGVGEIRTAERGLADASRRFDVDIVPLHGSLPLDAQRRAVEPAARRRVVLATNVAETALTIPGVTTVVDTGLARAVRYDARHGINRLELGPISKASADQRAGRAGRLGPGRCYRLWSVAEQAGRLDEETPEIRRLDLADLSLQLRNWGLAGLQALPWLDPPSAATIARAHEQLQLLGALDRDGNVTETGREMSRVGAEPRLARVWIESRRRRVEGVGALVAALASERDIRLAQRGPRERPTAADLALPGGSVAGSDLVECVDLFLQAEQGGFRREVCRRLDIDPRTVSAIDRARRQFSRRSGAAAATGFDEREIRRCVLAGFPDRVVRRREAGSTRGVMVGGTGVRIEPDSVVRGAEFYVAVDLDFGAQRRQREARVRLASAIEVSWLEELFPDALRDLSEHVFDPQRELVVRRRRKQFADLVLDEKLDGDVDSVEAAEVLAEAARRVGAAAFVDGQADPALLDRLRFLREHLPDMGIPALDELMAEVLGQLCQGRRSFAELRRVDWSSELRNRLPYDVQRALAEDAPRDYELPTGRAARIRYDEHARPTIQARIQELFGLTTTPKLARGRAPLVIELLAPNQRPVQVTEDLDSFWRSTYAEVRKQLRGRYPKHEWPEDPRTAAPTGRAKRRKK